MPLSGCDWPGELVATVFCQGCPWRCRYCHNTHLLDADRLGAVTWRSVMEFLRKRIGLLDGVVFSGGEPTLQRDLGAAMQEVRALGFRIGLHTAGPYPDRLSEVLPLLNWIGFDVKAPFDDYPRLTGVPGSGERARESLLRLIASGVAHEVRTTVHPDLLDTATLCGLAGALADLHVTRYALQACHAAGGTDGDPASAAAVAASAFPDTLRARFTNLTVRT
ncbi:MAG TPA: anaerobic ribonucleoside-triphosphate reductase activating protein [Rhodocyclaceae bacterium]|nr:anaerobic ribonucleoside-triphosphate reductase activating protein [Rhodocyclaceae bacterium]